MRIWYSLHNSGVITGIQWDIIHLGYEYGGYGHKQGGTIHVHGCSNRENKLGDTRVNIVLLHTAEGDWKCSSSKK